MSAPVEYRKRGQAVWLDSISDKMITTGRLAGQIAREDSEPVAELIHHAEKDANAENRLAAIQELGELSIHRPLIEPVLVRLQEGDPSTAIRETAEAALKKLRM